MSPSSRGLATAISAVVILGVGCSVKREGGPAGTSASVPASGASTASAAAGGGRGGAGATMAVAGTPSVGTKTLGTQGAAGVTTTAAGTPSPGTAALAGPGGVGAGPGLPPSDRVFTARAAGSDLLLGADANALWCAGPDGVVRWRRTGPGVAQEVVAGDLGGGERLYVAWGVGRGFLDAPLVLEALDPATGAATELWRQQGERNECAHLSIADPDRDGAPEVAFAHYSSKYFVKSRRFEADGSSGEGPEVRMATSHAHADLDGDGRSDTVIGRVYGDDKGLPGDLRVDRGTGPTLVPTENGVRSIAVAKIGDEPAPSLYFADGWVANYGKEAKARLKRTRWSGGQFVVEKLAESADEFTFFALTPVDADGDGRLELAAQGDKRVTLFWPDAGGAWRSRPIAALEPVLNTAIGRGPSGPVLYVPGRPATRAVPLRR